MVIFELGKVADQVTPEQSCQIFRQLAKCVRLTACDELHKLTREVRPAPSSQTGRAQSSRVRVAPGIVEIDELARFAPRTNFHSTSLTGARLPNSIPESPRQTHPQDANFGLGEDAAPPPKSKNRPKALSFDPR